MFTDFEKKFDDIKFVYFDIGNVLFSFSGGLERLAELFDKPFDEIKSYWISKDNEMCRGKLDPQEFWNQAKKYFRYNGDEINFVDFWIDHFSKIEKGHELAIRLSKSYKVGLLTNIYPKVFESIVHSDLLPKVNWDSVVKSCDYGFVKPERELFDIALERTGFKANEIILIDDIQENCDKAVECGWRSIQFKQ